MISRATTARPVGQREGGDPYCDADQAFDADDHARLSARAVRRARLAAQTMTLMIVCSFLAMRSKLRWQALQRPQWVLDLGRWQARQRDIIPPGSASTQSA